MLTQAQVEYHAVLVCALYNFLSHNSAHSNYPVSLFPHPSALPVLLLVRIVLLLYLFSTALKYTQCRCVFRSFNSKETKIAANYC